MMAELSQQHSSSDSSSDSPHAFAIAIVGDPELYTNELAPEDRSPGRDFPSPCSVFQSLAKSPSVGYEAIRNWSRIAA